MVILSETSINVSERSFSCRFYSVSFQTQVTIVQARPLANGPAEVSASSRRGGKYHGGMLLELSIRRVSLPLKTYVSRTNPRKPTNHRESSQSTCTARGCLPSWIWAVDSLRAAIQELNIVWLLIILPHKSSLIRLSRTHRTAHGRYRMLRNRRNSVIRYLTASQNSSAVSFKLLNITRDREGHTREQCSFCRRCHGQTDACPKFSLGDTEILFLMVSPCEFQLESR